MRRLARLVNYGEVLHLEATGAVRVEEHRRTYAIGADHGLETGKGYIETGGLGGLWSEETELDFGLTSGIGDQGE